ncbi:mitotic inducer phosphatase cdc25 [Rhizodiscina lignyota]|uniref:M-phase inducer phosphatase n=1 Tax=Rhizodiscina lignyota TaxID=1504668 RepID=A0A9P4ILR5_9PEZI|nr:mitotic inducer phosphatase cdc25 [Rhizodiscina lignyota]
MGSNPFGTNNFNFKDMSMLRSQSDYFSGTQVRGSSPAASLAADLSQNFHIDQSPQLPTPRRSLFTANLFQLAAAREGATTPPIRWEGVTTPPIPSSSPGFGHDSMDISPLPHKVPFARTSDIVPTPDTETTLDDAMSSPPVMTSDSSETQSSDRPRLQRRKSSAPRPSLLRSAKFFSTNTVAHQAREPDTQLPPFKFGAGIGAAVAPSLSLDDIEDSPPQQRNMFDSGIMGPPRPRQLFSHTSNSSRSHGSPLAGLSKKPPFQVPRPRKQFRRSNSMFEHPGDIMKQEKRESAQTGLQSIMDVDDTHQLALPHFMPVDRNDGIPRITQETMLQVLDGQYNSHFDNIKVVDCRFEYEFNGGHINGAVNHNDKEGLAQALFQQGPSRTLLLLHCEFSVHRAPLMAEHVRRHDRRVNEASYPKLNYPELYVLDGGYNAFYRNHRTRCFPQNYVEMDAQGHEATCERELEKLRRRGKLNRAATYAFGETTCDMQDSPTAGARSTASFDGDPRRAYNRRMASY